MYFFFCILPNPFQHLRYSQQSKSTGEHDEATIAIFWGANKPRRRCGAFDCTRATFSRMDMGTIGFADMSRQVFLVDKCRYYADQSKCAALTIA